MGTHFFFKGGVFPRNSAHGRSYFFFMGVPLLRLSGSFERIIDLYQSVESRPFCGGWGTVGVSPGSFFEGVG